MAFTNYRSRQQFRVSLGLSQAEAALLLGTNKSSLSLYELGKYERLPVDCLLTEAELQMIIEAAATTNIAEPDPDEALRTSLLKQLADAEYGIASCEYHLDNMIARYNTIKLLSHVLQQRRLVLDAASREYLAIDIIARGLPNKLKRVGRIAQCDLKIKLAGFKAQAASLQLLLDEIEQRQPG